MRRILYDKRYVRTKERFCFYDRDREEKGDIDRSLRRTDCGIQCATFVGIEI